MTSKRPAPPHAGGVSAARDRRVAGLSGTGRLADDLWLLAHHEKSGRPHLQPRALGVGLAGALVGELVLAGDVRIWRGLAVPVSPRLPADEVTRGVLQAMAGEQEQRPVRDWLLFLRRTAPANVAGRLAADGYLARPARRLPWRRERWAPVDADSAFAPLVRVKAALATGTPAGPQPVVLGALATACGLDHQLALYLPPGARQHLLAAAGRLPPGLRELAAATQSVVESALLAHRI
jgi:Golgi phosphoprotein 3 (GPP34)